MNFYKINISLATISLVLLGTISWVQSEPTSDEVAQLFLKQQQGIDRAKTIWVEWITDVNGKHITTNSYIHTPSIFRGVRQSKDTSTVSTYNYDKKKAVIIQTRSGVPQAVIASYSFFWEHYNLFEGLGVFFPALRHFWYATPKHVLDEMREN